MSNKEPPAPANLPQAPDRLQDADRPVQQATFDAAGIGFGARLQLTARRASGADTHSSVLIGLDPRRVLLVRHPFEQGLAVPLAEGAELGVRLFTGTRVLMFETTVERALRAPSWYLMLAWPASVHVVRLRGVRRADVRLAVQVECASGRRLDATLTDLSATGARLQAEGVPPGEAGEAIECAFALPDGGGEPERLRLKARIRTVRPLEKPGGAPPASWQCGLEFIEVDRLASLSLKAYVHGLLVGAD